MEMRQRLELIWELEPETEIEIELRKGADKSWAVNKKKPISKRPLEKALHLNLLN